MQRKTLGAGTVQTLYLKDKKDKKNLKHLKSSKITEGPALCIVDHSTHTQLTQRETLSHPSLPFAPSPEFPSLILKILMLPLPERSLKKQQYTWFQPAADFLLIGRSPFFNL